ncbi:hypothetical protein OGZ02_16190 [Brachyspira hyodysenteriae]|nr:hypothetical protein [Brachyspira hyodysenteriae]MDA1470311.1 hypothetical protein [Brachyspira hyodysenteriae]
MATAEAFLDEVYQNAVEAEVNKGVPRFLIWLIMLKKIIKEISAYEDLKARLDTLSTASKSYMVSFSF